MGGHDGSKRQPKDPCHGAGDRTTNTKTFEGSGKAEANVSVDGVQQATPGVTTHEFEYVTDTKSSNSHDESTGSEESSPRVDTVLSTKPTVATIDRHKDKVFALAVAGDLLYTASDSTDIRVFRAPTFEEVDCFGSGNGMVQSLMAFADTLYSAHQDNKIRVWKRVRSTGSSKCKHKLLAVLPRLDHFVKSMLLERNYVQVRRHKKKLWIEHADTISALALGGSGRSGDEMGGDSGWRPPPAVLYSASWDRTVKVWSLSNYKCIESFYAHSDAINAMIVIDGLVLATASADCSIKLWTRLSPASSRKRRHSLLSTLHGHKAPVNALAISENAKVLYSGGSDGAVIAWKKVYNKPRARSPYHSTIHTTKSGTISSTLSGDAFLRKIGSAGSGDIEMISGADCLPSNESGEVQLSRENSWTKHVAGLRRGNHHTRAVVSGVSFVMRKVMVGHTRAVLSVSTVGDNIVCSSSADKTIRVWRRQAGPELSSTILQQLHGRSDSGSSGGKSVWEYECMAVLAGHGGPVKSIASVLCATARHLVCRESVHAVPQVCTAADKDDVEDEDNDHYHYHTHNNGVVVYSAGLDSKVKVWVLPLQR